MNKPEWVSLLIGCTACLIDGALVPVAAVLVTGLINASELS
jgi:hypothetical protein